MTKIKRNEFVYPWSIDYSGVSTLHETHVTKCPLSLGGTANSKGAVISCDVH